MTKRKSWIRDAVTDDRGDFDVAQIGVMVLISMALAAGIVAAVALFAGRDPQPFGMAIGAICGGFATALGALGVYKWGDKRSVPPVEGDK